jgi:WD40 repeat protein
VLNNGNLASTSADQTVKIWDPSSGTLIKTLTVNYKIFLSLAVLNNGYLASGDYNGIIRI